MKTTDNLDTCSFCNKHKDTVTKLIVGEGVAICNECVDLCQTLLVDKPELSDTSPNLDHRKIYLPAQPSPEILKTGCQSA